MSRDPARRVPRVHFKGCKSCRKDTRNKYSMYSNGVLVQSITNTTTTMTQITFSCIIALGLMSFLIPSEATVASTSIISFRKDLNIVDQEKIKGNDKEVTREKRDDNLHSSGGSSEFNIYMDFNSSFDSHDKVPHKYGPWESGPMKTISDSLFSLIILIYVAVIFIFMFFSFCWKEPEPPPPDPAHKNIPMITSMLDEMEKQMEENNKREEEKRASIETEEAENECTEMAEIKRGTDNPIHEGKTTTESESRMTLTNGKELERNMMAPNRKDAETIVVNVITETTKGSLSVSIKEEQV